MPWRDVETDPSEVTVTGYNFGTVVVVTSEDRTKRACYVEHEGVRIDLPTQTIERCISADGVDETTLTLAFNVRWEQAP